MTADRPVFQNLYRFQFVLLFLLGSVLLSPLAVAGASPTKSPNDPNEYRFLELDNGLRVILASDPEADKAAASMNVAVGSGNDPANREGLAHFLEHLLFLGTEQYPDPGAYQQFIRSHGGSHNAFTAFADINYFFDVGKCGKGVMTAAMAANELLVLARVRILLGSQEQHMFQEMCQTLAVGGVVAAANSDIH